MMNIDIHVTGNPYAVEVLVDGKVIGVVRWDSTGNWKFHVATHEGIPWEVLEYIDGFKKLREKSPL
jgi:predicted RNA-binding protein with PUA domain